MDRRASGVLLVDPDRRVRTALRTLLTAAGVVVCGEAADPHAARSAADRRRPRFAVVDPLLPTAAAGCSLIDELHREVGAVVIALTSDPRLVEPARSAGAARVLTKDCAPDELLAALQIGPTLPAPRTAPTRPRVAVGAQRLDPSRTSARGGTGRADPD